jgi:nucleolar MIF4G domain-containing protein 1
VANSRRRNEARSRRENRKLARLEKKKGHVQLHGKPKHSPIQDVHRVHRKLQPQRLQPNDAQPTRASPANLPSYHAAKTHDSYYGAFQSSEEDTQAPPQVRSKQLDQEDAKIEALEKALGLKKGKLPKAFDDDGLDDLLGDLGAVNDSDDGTRGIKRIGDEELQWLRNKRRKASTAKVPEEMPHTRIVRKSAGTISEASDDSEIEEEKEDQDNEDEELELQGEELNSQDGVPGSQANFAKLDDSGEAGSKAARENPYKPPIASSITAAKYVPPSLRGKNASENEALQRLRRRIKGLLNRMSEVNLLSIVAEFESLYRDNPRQHVSSSIIDLIMAQLNDVSALNDTFMVLHGGFVAALYKIVGADFGAQVVQRLVEEFEAQYNASTQDTDKRLSNLVSFLAEVYNYQVIGSQLIYDFIRIFSSTISEANTELLLRVIKHSGPQLRQDNPSSLKEIVLHLQAAVQKAGGLERLSVRTRYMMDTINDLKNNRVKAGAATANILSDHTVRMKRLLGTMNNRQLKASEPLQISIEDIRNSAKRGKWWLVGASYRDKNDDMADLPVQTTQDTEVVDGLADDSVNLSQLARQQGMNTDVRRSIFVTLMSATDYKEAHFRLLKLNLKNKQQPEIAKVIVHCAAGEGRYNPYYTLVARQFCADRKYKIAFQFALWDQFKRMEGSHDVDMDEDGRSQLTLPAMVALAKMYGTLIADGGLSLSVLKVSHLLCSGKLGRTNTSFSTSILRTYTPRLAISWSLCLSLLLLKRVEAQESKTRRSNFVDMS